MYLKTEKKSEYRLSKGVRYYVRNKGENYSAKK